MANLTATLTSNSPLTRLTAQRFGPSVVIFSVVIGVVALLVLVPMLIVFLKSFEVSQPGVTSVTTGLDHWRTLFSDPRILNAFKNTATLALTRQAIALMVGVALAWAIARTNVPGRRWLELGFWVALFLPTLTVTLGWIIMFDGTNGLVNRALVNVVWFIDEPPFQVFSWWGIVFAQLTTGAIALTVMLLTPAFRNVDAGLEEASRALGASTFVTLRRIIVPSLFPAIAVVTLLGIIRSFEAFEIELVLGAPEEIDVISTIIFSDALGESARFGTATALATMFLALLVPLVALQQWLASRRGSTTFAGKQAVRVLELGRWKWPVFAVIAGLLLFMTVIPILLVALSTFTGFFWGGGSWTLEIWRSVAAGAGFTSALRNSLALGVGASVLAMTAFTYIGYFSTRTNLWDRRYFDVLMRVPSTIPGMIVSLGFLVLFLSVEPLRNLTGYTMLPLVIPVALGGMTLGMQVVRSSLATVGTELEDASLAVGAGRIHSFRHVLLPRVTPGILVVGVLAFVTAVRATSTVALLATERTSPLSLTQLNHVLSGEFSEAAVMGVFLVVLITGGALSARILGLKAGILPSWSIR